MELDIFDKHFFDSTIQVADTYGELDYIYTVVYPVELSSFCTSEIYGNGMFISGKLISGEKFECINAMDLILKGYSN